MELFYQQQELSSQIHYGETLASQLKQQQKYVERQTVILTNQRYYDLFAEKITRLFPEASLVDWYVCANDVHCNNMNEFNSLLDFMKRYGTNENYLIVGFGNEGVIELASFFQKVTPLQMTLWLWPVSIRSFAQGLVTTPSILQAQNQPIMTVTNISQQMFYDQTIGEGQKAGKLVDFLTLITCGIVCDHAFLRLLFENYPTPERLESQPLTGMLENVVGFYMENEKNITSYGKLFEQAFYRVENGHLLSTPMKRFFGILFQLCWNQVISGWSFQLENFVRWLAGLGYPIDWVAPLSPAAYLEEVYELGKVSKKLLVLEKISIIKEYRRPSEQELVSAMALYQKIVREIRGN